MARESVRQRKVADKIQQVVSVIVDREISDPDKGFVTITHVKISPDLSIASIYFTVLGDEEQKAKSLATLNRAKRFIRSELAPRLKLRNVPELRFFPDDTLEYARKIEDLLQKVKEQDKTRNSDES